ncbi:MAG: hypothetical protein ABI559_11880 [Chloroflexota bacterium]
MQQPNKNMNVVGGNSLAMVMLRLWLWLVPALMLFAALLFGAIAVSDGRWALFAVMFVLGILAISMLAFHYWLLFRFGKSAEGPK